MPGGTACEIEEDKVPGLTVLEEAAGFAGTVIMVAETVVELAIALECRMMPLCPFLQFGKPMEVTIWENTLDCKAAGSTSADLVMDTAGITAIELSIVAMHVPFETYDVVNA